MENDIRMDETSQKHIKKIKKIIGILWNNLPLEMKNKDKYKLCMRNTRMV